MKKLIKFTCILLCFIMSALLFTACAKPEDSQGSTTDKGVTIKLSDFFEEEVYNFNKIKYTTLTALTDNISWNSTINDDIWLTVKKDFYIHSISFDVKALEDFADTVTYFIFFNCNPAPGKDDTVFKAVNDSLYNEKYKLKKSEEKSFSIDFTKTNSKGCLLKASDIFRVNYGYYESTVDNLRFTIKAA